MRTVCVFSVETGAVVHSQRFDISIWGSSDSCVADRHTDGVFDKASDDLPAALVKVPGFLTIYVFLFFLL